MIISCKTDPASAGVRNFSSCSGTSEPGSSGASESGSSGASEPGSSGAPESGCSRPDTAFSCCWLTVSATSFLTFPMLLDSVSVIVSFVCCLATWFKSRSIFFWVCWVFASNTASLGLCHGSRHVACIWFRSVESVHDKLWW